jgi:hypothetical protein
MFRDTRTGATTTDGDEPRPVPHRRLRPVVAGCAILATVVIATAILMGAHERDATSASQADAHSATVTVRRFLDSAVVDDDTYLACQYLTPAAQARLAGLQGAAATCSDVLASSPPTLFNLSSAGAVARLSLRTTVHGPTAEVVATHSGQAPVTFVLHLTSADERYVYGSPPTAWRIVTGADQLLAVPSPVHDGTPVVAS